MSVEPHSGVEGVGDAVVRGNSPTGPVASSNAGCLWVSVTVCHPNAIPGPGTTSLLIRGSNCPGPAMFAAVTPGGNV